LITVIIGNGSALFSILFAFKKGRGVRMMFAYGLGDTTIFFEKKNYDLKFNLADFIEKFRVE
jgi:hypothetical protein